MLAAGTSRVTAEPTGTGPQGAPVRRAPGWAGPLLLVAVAAGLLGQGAYYGPGQRLLGLTVAAVTVLTLVAWPPGGDDLRLPPVLPAAALAAWALVDALLLGLPAAGAAGIALLLGGLVAVLLVCRRLGPEDREVLLLGVTGTALVVAFSGWVGVAGRVGALAWEGDGIWRASGTLTYPNAAAAVLVPVALVVLGRLAQAPRSVAAAVAATGLLAGAAATMSRAGVAALAVGLVVLALLQGPRRTVRAAAGPCAGALLALVGLVPSMPAAGPARPALAAAGLVAGLALAAVAARATAAWAAGIVAGVVLAGGLALAVAAGGAGQAYRTAADARATLASPDRGDALRAAADVVAAHPLGGGGPGHTRLRWEDPDGVVRLFAYAHNEYVQVAAELGLVGLGLLAVLLAALARLLWRARPAGPGQPTWAGVVAAAVAFAVHSALDFTWHLPAVVLTVLLLVGVVLPPPAAARRPIPQRKGSP